MASLELTNEELSFMEMLVSKSQVDTRIEIHHARRSFDFRNYLKEREVMITNLLQKLQSLQPEKQLVMHH